MQLGLWVADSQVGAVASDNMTPIVIVNWDGATSPEDLADAAYAAIESTTAGRRWLFFRHMADGERTGYVQVGNNSVEDYFIHRSGEFDRVRSDLVRFWVQFSANGSVRPDRIVFDEEDLSQIELPGSITESTWAERAAKIARVNNHPVLSKYSPHQLRAYTEAQIAAITTWDSDIGNAIMWWLHNNVQIFLDTLGKAVVGTYQSVLGEPCPPTYNYGDELLDRNRTGFQNERHHKGERSVAGVSGPNLYLNRFSALPPIFSGQTSAHRWLMFLYNQNWMRALRRTSLYEPWFSYPTWDNITNTGTLSGWQYNLQAAAAMGVSRGLAWAPSLQMGSGGVPSLSTQLANMQAALEDLPSRQVDDDEVLPFIPYSATSVTIGGWSVTYNASDWGTT